MAEEHRGRTGVARQGPPRAHVKPAHVKQAGQRLSDGESARARSSAYGDTGWLPDGARWPAGRGEATPGSAAARLLTCRECRGVTSVAAAPNAAVRVAPDARGHSREHLPQVRIADGLGERPAEPVDEDLDLGRPVHRVVAVGMADTRSSRPSSQADSASFSTEQLCRVAAMVDDLVDRELPGTGGRSSRRRCAGSTAAGPTALRSYRRRGTRGRVRDLSGRVGGEGDQWSARGQLIDVVVGAWR